MWVTRWHGLNSEPPSPGSLSPRWLDRGKRRRLRGGPWPGTRTVTLGLSLAREQKFLARRCPGHLIRTREHGARWREEVGAQVPANTRPSPSIPHGTRLTSCSAHKGHGHISRVGKAEAEKRQEQGRDHDEGPRHSTCARAAPLAPRISALAWHRISSSSTDVSGGGSTQGPGLSRASQALHASAVPGALAGGAVGRRLGGHPDLAERNQCSIRKG